MANTYFPTSNFAKWKADSEGFVNAGEVDRFNWSLDLWANEVEHWGKYEERCGFELWRSVNAPLIAAAGIATITFNTIDYDSGGWFTQGSSLVNIVVPPGKDGIYTASCNSYFGAPLAGGGFLLAGIRRNGAAIGSNQAVPPNMDRIFVNIAGFRVEAGDIISMYINNSTGAGVTPTSYAGDPSSPRLLAMTMYRLSR